MPSQNYGISWNGFVLLCETKLKSVICIVGQHQLLLYRHVTELPVATLLSGQGTTRSGGGGWDGHKSRGWGKLVWGNILNERVFRLETCSKDLLERRVKGGR